MRPILFWFRRDLRLSDNAALTAAVESGRPIVPLYVVDEPDLGRASAWWLQHSLASLDRDLRQFGSSLLIRSGSPQNVIAEIAAQSDAEALYYTQRYEPKSRRQEDDVGTALEESLDVRAFGDSFLHHPETVMTVTGTPYRVFTPFWKAASGLAEPRLPLPAPDSIIFTGQSLDSLSPRDLGLVQSSRDKARRLQEIWTPGESAGLQRIDDLESTLEDYAKHRDRPDIDSTSRLSPHLCFGEVSVRQVWHAVRRMQMTCRTSTGGEVLLKQLYWRDFSNYLLFHFPDLPDVPLRREFESFPWSENGSFLQAWQQGMTGYPVVDAGMRQLNHTGWMHNRVRMIAASFLVKDLLVPWQKGAAWFLDELVDADLANNSASWQWVAGCGSDAAPYFRIFNPVLQAEKFDPHGRYVRKWIPELTASSTSTYPEPIVDHGQARRIALGAYQSIKGMRTSKSAP